MVTIASPEQIGDQIRSTRRGCGLTQSELAERCGVSRKWLGEVEAGHARAEIGLVAAVMAALDIEMIARPETHRRPDPNLLTVPRLAAHIKDEVASGDTSFALRLIGRSLAEGAELGDAELYSFLAEPPSTGDIRWDTLIAAAFRRQCRLCGKWAPEWTAVGSLRSWWFPINDRLLIARTMQRTPPDFSTLGIWLDPKALSVA